MTQLAIKEFTTYVIEKRWAPDDSYLAVPLGDVQVIRGFIKGDEVKVTITIEKVQK